MRVFDRFTLAVMLGALAVCASPVHAANDRPLIYGMNPMPSEWAGRPAGDYTWEGQQYDKMRLAGCTAVRIGVGWDLIEPNPGDRNWGDIDGDITRMLDRGFEPVLLIVATPTWALLPGQGVSFYPPQPQFRPEFEKFVYDCARKFRGRVKYYEFWNEPNGYGWNREPGGNTFSKAWEYVPWLMHGYGAIKKGDPNALWSIGGMDDNGGGGDYYLGLCYNYMAKGYFDAVCDHPYSSSTAELWKLDDLRAKMAQYGDALPVWITEMGWPANGRETQVAGWITDYLTRLSGDAYSYCKIATYHTSTDFTAEPVGYGLMTYSLQTKPTYDAFYNLTKPARATVTSAPTVTVLGPSKVRVTFTSSIPATAQIMYGLTNAYGMVTARETTESTSHTFTIDGLQPNTTYHYRIRLGAGDYADNFSANYTFKPATGSAVSLVGNVVVSNITANSATVSWTTNVASTSTVEWGEGYDYSYSVSNGATLETNHSLTLTGLHPHKVFQARVISTRSGYGNLVKEIEPITTRRAPRLLDNPGFESYGPKQPWVIYGRNDGRITGTWYQGMTARTGSAFFGSAASWDHKSGGCYQQVGAVPGKAYWVSAWTRSYQLGGTPGADVARVGIDPAGGHNPNDPGIVWGPWTYSPTDWKRMDVTSVAYSDEITVYVDISQPYGFEWNINIVDDVELRESDPYMPIGAVKSAEVGVPVAAEGVVCTANFGGYSYVQATDGTSALRVNGPCFAEPGDTVAFTGVVSFVGPEKCVEAAMIAVTGRGGTVEPVGMLARDVGGAPLDGQTILLANATGANTLCKLVKLCGIVTARGAGYYYVDDGSGCADASGNAGIRVITPGSGSEPVVGSMVSVWGIAAAEQINGQWAPVLRQRAPTDQVIHSQ
jgi:hypothetical protein